MEAPPPLFVARTIRDFRRDRAYAPGGAVYEQTVQSHLPLVHGVIARLLEDCPAALEEAVLSMFQTFAARWKKLPRKTVIASWLLRTCGLAAANARKRHKAPPIRRGSGPGLTLRALHLLEGRLNDKMRGAALLTVALADSAESAGERLGLKPAAVERLRDKALAKLQKLFRKYSVAEDAAAYLAALPVSPSADLEFAVLQEARQWTPKAERSVLARRTIGSWRWIGVRRFFAGVLKGLGVTVCLLVALGFTFKYLAENGHLTGFFVRREGQELAKRHPRLLEPAKAFPATEADKALVRASEPRNSADLYTLTNIYTAKLTFTKEQWEAIEPKGIPGAKMHQNGRLHLINPNAKRNGLIGMVGLEYDWTTAQLEFAGRNFTNVGVRYRGNGTYLNSQYTPKRSFKVDLNKETKGQKVAGIDELNFLNCIVDFSYLHDALAEQLFRDLGVPAPRTAYAYVTVDAPPKHQNQPFGLYVMVENIDGDFAKDRFGSKKTPIFKPVTYDLFKDLGSEWKQYDRIYDLKTEATPAQLQRVIDFAKLVSHGSDEEFEKRFAEFVDVEEFAAFLAGNVLISAYDSFLSMGQNYYMYLGPDNRFGFISWDHDHSWGEFGYVGTIQKREQASIWKPYTYNHHFLKRALKVEKFRAAYKAKLEHAMEHVFVPERLNRQIDQFAAVIRPAVAAENPVRLERFEKCVSSELDPISDHGPAEGPDKPPHQLKRFVQKRWESVREQLDGKSEGVVLNRDR
ncbi:MAG TPA: CotH kinase family protein [Methylomirabilota bacterium]|nr:CotH kinase family protein [Methylomirabilota bacterium]